MSRLYGTLTNENGSKRTMTAHHDVTATAQSWGGSVQVSMVSDKNDPLPPYVELHAMPGSTTEAHGFPLWGGRLDRLLGARLVPAERHGASGDYARIILRSKDLPESPGWVPGRVILALLFNHDGTPREYATYWQRIDDGSTHEGRYYDLSAGAAAHAGYEERDF